MPMRDYENLKDITIPQRQEAIMNIFCDSWQECRESDCKNCPDRQNRHLLLMECFSLKCSRKLIEAGCVFVDNPVNAKRMKNVKFETGDRAKIGSNVSEHGFAIGTVVTLKKGKEDYAAYADGDFWWVTDDDRVEVDVDNSAKEMTEAKMATCKNCLHNAVCAQEDDS